MRREDWPARLNEWVEQAHAKQFAYGSWDCCLSVCDLVLSMTGRDPAAWFRGRYSTKKGAYVLLRKFAGGGVAETWSKIAREMGFSEVPPLMAQRGDVCLVRTELGDALGICLGGRIACAGPDGLAELRLTNAVRAWRI